MRDFYVDDLLTGADTIDEARRAREEVVEVLRLGQFELGKWASNCPEILKDAGGSSQGRMLGKEAGHKVLGMSWEPLDDKFRFSIARNRETAVKLASVLYSKIASLFDPLGLLGPITIIAKIIMQDIWRSGLEWDESLPEDIHEKWIRLRQQLPRLNDLRMSRWVGFGGDARCVQLHGFCDASKRAYGACVYVRRKSATGLPLVELLISKSRVAPMKAISVPRLELSAD